MSNLEEGDEAGETAEDAKGPERVGRDERAADRQQGPALTSVSTQPCHSRGCYVNSSSGEKVIAPIATPHSLGGRQLVSPGQTKAGQRQVEHGEADGGDEGEADAVLLLPSTLREPE